MKKFIIVLLLLLIVLGTYFYFKTNYYISSTTGDAGSVAKIAVENGNPLLCDKITIPFQILPGETQESLKAYCYFQVAKQLKNPEICNYITDPNSRFYKDSTCITNIAVETNNINSCDLITDQLSKGGCYVNFTKKGANRSICETVTDWGERSLLFWGCRIL